MKSIYQNFTYEEKKEIGQRIKKVVKENALSNKEIGEMWGFENEKHVCRIFNGTTPLSDVNLEKTARAFNIRKDYLLYGGLKTDLEILQHERTLDVSAFKTCKDYLLTLGYELTPFLSLSIDIVSLYRQWNLIAPFITNNSLDILSDITNEYVNTKDHTDFIKTHFGDYVSIELKEPIDSINIPYSDVGKESGNINKIISVHGDDIKKLNINHTYHVGYRLSYKKESIGVYSVEDMQKLFNLIDSYTKCTIENFINNECKMYSFNT